MLICMTSDKSIVLFSVRQNFRRHVFADGCGALQGQKHSLNKPNIEPYSEHECLAFFTSIHLTTCAAGSPMGVRHTNELQENITKI